MGSGPAELARADQSEEAGGPGQVAGGGALPRGPAGSGRVSGGGEETAGVLREAVLGDPLILPAVSGGDWRATIFI